MDKRIKQKIKKFTLITVGVLAITFILCSWYFLSQSWVTKKLTEIKESSMIKEWKSIWIVCTSIEYSNDVEFILAVGKCIGYHNLMLSYEVRVHRDIIVAMAVLETGYGESRFAKEAQ